MNITDYDAEYDEWYRDGDDILKQLHDWISENATIEYINYSKVPSELLASNKIYINGGLVETARLRFSIVELSGATIPFDEVYMDSDGLAIYGYGVKLL